MFDRLRPNARALLAFATLAALHWLWGANPSPDGLEVVRADFGVTGAALIVSAVVNFLGGLFRGRIDPNVSRALDGMRGSIRDIGDAIVKGLAWLAGNVATVLAAVKRFIQRTFGPLFDMLRNLVMKISRILDRIIGPIIDFLVKVKEHVWAIYRDIVRPILDIIEFIRIPLRILSLFGIEWAKKLDATLAAIEDEIVENFAFVMGKLNQAINFLNEIVDVNGLLKRITLMRSLMRDGKLWLSYAWFTSHRPLELAKRQDYTRDVPTVLAEARVEQLGEYMRSGGGELAPLIDETLADALLVARRVRSGL